MKIRNTRVLVVVGFHLLGLCFVQCDQKYVTPSAVDAMSPVIDRISPEFGGPGNEITIEGKNFGSVANNVEVLFNDSAADDVVQFRGTKALVTNFTPTAITVLIPQDAMDGKISVTVNGVKTTTIKDFTVTKNGGLTSVTIP